MSDKIKEAIEESPLFKHLEAAWLERLVDSATLERVEAGGVIVEEGAEARSLYVVVRGKVRVWTEADERNVELKTLGAGAYFGEVSLLSGKQATATVEAKSDEVELVAIDGQALRELVEADDKVRRMLEGVTLARAKDTIGKVLD